ncbi:MAG TPA: ABC transporter permease subunit [Planctomycetota bacterium]|nr:ABC transporter permease subunit [Planctomycetota bacterium]
MKAGRAVTTVVFFAAALAAWQAVAGKGTRHLFPPPTEVAAYLVRGTADGSLLGAAWVTLGRLLLGYGIGLALGVPLGVLTARFRPAADTLGLVALGLQTLPSVCWVPLAILWFGQSELALLFVVAVGTVWAVMLAVDGAVRSVPPIYLRAARTMGSRGLHALLFVTLPAGLPYVVSGFRQGWAFAWRSLMAAEIYVTVLGGFGLGQLLHYGRELHAMDQVLGVMLLVVAVGLVADRGLFAPVERRIHRRWGLAA